jgi:hypothetical protein
LSQSQANCCSVNDSTWKTNASVPLSHSFQKKLNGGLSFIEDAQQKPWPSPLRGKLETLAAAYEGKPIFGIRPEQVSDPTHVSVIEISEPMSSESIVYLKAGTGNLFARVPAKITPILRGNWGATRHGEAHLFDAQTERVVK